MRWVLAVLTMAGFATLAIALGVAAAVCVDRGWIVG